MTDTKVFSFFLLIMFSFPYLQAQLDWESEDIVRSYRWIHTYQSPNEIDHFLRFKKDTIINGIKCTILKSELPYRPHWELIDYPDIIFYQEDDVVYRYANDRFTRLYDFSLGVGDTIHVYLPEVAADQWDDRSPYVVHRIDSVKTITIGGHDVRAQFHTPIFGPVYTFDGWTYEYLGNISYYFVPYNAANCDGACPESMLCFSYPGAGIRHSFDPDRPCDSILATSRQYVDVSERISLYPNPTDASGQTRLIIPADLAASRATLTVYDQAGRMILQRQLAPGTRRPGVELAEVVSGVYYVEWRNAKGRAVRKLVVR